MAYLPYPPIERNTPDKGGNPLIPACQSRTSKNAYQSHLGLHDDIRLGTAFVPITGPWPGQGVHWPVFPLLWDDWKNNRIKPRLSYAINQWSSIGHRSGVTGVGYKSGTLTFPGRHGHPPFSPPNAGIMDPVAAGDGYDMSRFNPDAYPVIPAQVPLVSQAKVRNTNRRGGTGMVIPNPLANVQWPFYVNSNTQQ